MKYYPFTYNWGLMDVLYVSKKEYEELVSAKTKLFELCEKLEKNNLYLDSYLDKEVKDKYIAYKKDKEAKAKQLERNKDLAELKRLEAEVSKLKEKLIL
jgi:hypothetical protein